MPLTVALTRAPRRLLAGALALAPLFAQAVLQDPEVEARLRELLREQAVALENGEGVERDPARAAALYCEAARMGDAVSQYNLGWMYANGRGIERSDTDAAFFFHAAAEQGLEQAQRMLERVGGAPTYVPDCVREPQPAPAPGPMPRAVPAPPPAPAAPLRSNGPPHLVELVKRIAPEFRIEPRLALAFIEVESNFDPTALSPKNAKGLMQLIPATLERFNVSRPYDPVQNIRGGLAYLRWLLAYFEGDVTLVAAGYNAGEGTVNRYRGVPPYAETRAYVQRILALARMATHPFDPAATEPSPQLALIRAPVRRSPFLLRPAGVP